MKHFKNIFKITGGSLLALSLIISFVLPSFAYGGKILTRKARPDPQVKLLLKAFGANGSQVFKDFSQSGHTITANGNAQMSTTQAKFPPVGISFDGTGDYLTIPDSANWDYGTNNFTIDFWIRWNSVALSYLVVQGDAGASFCGVYWYNNKIWFDFTEAAATHRSYASWTPSVDTWYHVAVVRVGSGVGETKIAIDGVFQAMTLDAGSWDYNITGLNKNLFIGARGDPNYFLNGYMDNIRIINGRAEWTSNFTPPTRRH